MPLNYISDIKPLEDAGKTDAEIAGILKSRTVTDIPSMPVRRYFINQNLWLIDPSTGVRTAGTIGAAYGGLTAQQKTFLLKFHAWVYTDDSIETENNDEVAVLASTIMTAMVNLGLLTLAQANKVYTFGGGLANPTATEQDVIDSRAAYVAATAVQADIAALATEWATAQNEGGINSALAIGDRAAMVIALRAAADSIEGV